MDITGMGGPMLEEFDHRIGGGAQGFTFTMRTKEEALVALQLLVQQHAIRFDDPQLKTELELYQRDDKGLVTDCVMAAAIMAWVLKSIPPSGNFKNNDSGGCDWLPSEF
jgi:hypothetical protein